MLGVGGMCCASAVGRVVHHITATRATAHAPQISNPVGGRHRERTMRRPSQPTHVPAKTAIVEVRSPFS